MVKNEKEHKIIKKRLDEVLYQEMLNSFMEGCFKAGEEFNLPEIAAKYSVSLTPVTLAFKRLYYEHLIDRTSGGHYFVSNYDVEKMNQLCDARYMVEGKCLCHLCEQQDEKVLAEMENYAKKSKAAFDEGNLLLSKQHDFSFHKALVDSLNNIYISQFYKQIRNQLLCWNYAINFSDQNQKEAVDGHFEMLKQIKMRNKEASMEKLKIHIDHARDRMVGI